jgi:ElaB/YqjD/DUF883 family membrane-anchored ribosome-binding protein
MSDQGTAAQAKDKAQELTGQAQEKAHEAAEQTRDRLRSQVDERSTQAGRQVTGRAQDLRSVAEQLRRQGQAQPARVTDQAAERLERAGTWLSDSDADRILSDVEDFARRNPWAVMAGAAALGFAASRMLKASSSNRYESRMGGGDSRSLPAPLTGGEERFTRAPSGTAGPQTPATPPAPVTPPAAPPAGTGGISGGPGVA